jgi:excisionase family DNA binding protein
MIFLNKKQLAEYLNVEIKTVRYLLYSGKIPKVRIGREYRFIQEDIDIWIRGRIEKPKKYKFGNTIN